ASAGEASSLDTVRLKDGRTFQGVVDDRGDVIVIAITRDGGVTGEVRITRDQILSIELDGTLKRTRDDLDVVILLSGDEIAGKVELRQNGRQVAVIQNNNEVTFDQRQVKAILWSHRAESEQRGADGGGLGRTVEKLIETIEHGNREEKAIAYDQLLNLGVFALPYLEARKGRVEVPEVEQAIARTLAVAQARTLMSPFLVERIPNLSRRLTDPDAEARLSALKEAVIQSPQDCPPLFAHMVRTERSPSVRAFLLGQLTLMNRVEELKELLNTEDLALKMGAALALGDNGVFVGLRLVIDSLRHERQDVRSSAGPSRASRSSPATPNPREKRPSSAGKPGTRSKARP
ncbi:MAG: HEAT repeat domain-containing protein, partial [Planctomycetota bacterium]